MSLKKKSVRELIRDVAEKNSSITAYEPSYSWGGGEAFAFDVTGSNREKAAAYRMLDNAFVKAGLSTSEPELYKQIHQSRLDYEALEKEDQQAVQNYMKAKNGRSSYSTSGSGSTAGGSSNAAGGEIGGTGGSSGGNKTGLLKFENGYSPEDDEETRAYWRQMMQMGEISEAEYYNKLEELNPKFHTENSKEWREWAVEIYQGRQKLSSKSSGSSSSSKKEKTQSCR